MKNYYLLLLTLLALVFSALFFACSEDANPLPSKAHPASWTDMSSADFHGIIVVSNGSESCQTCHGTDYMGGESGQSCYTCHNNFPHPQTWLTASSTDFHGNYIRNDGWDMSNCKTCHGEDYLGGSSNSSCARCHSNEGGPEACNVCHGGGDHINPPEDLYDNIETTAMGVGAHELHLAQTWIQCSTCHVVPQSFADPVHIDAAPADVKDTVGWDRDTATCSKACHPAEGFVWNQIGEHM